MSLRTTYSAESWDQVYKAFSEINFTSFDFDTIKQSLVDYARLYYPEQFNDYIQSSEFIMLIEMFAYVAEQLSYRIDMVAHENFITTAQRKQSILRLAKLISYKATRNVAVRGLVKITSLTTTEQVYDSRGINLSGTKINWNDPNNNNWKEQFFLAAGRVLNSRFGEPQKTYQIGDVVMDLYSLKNNTSSFPLGVFPFTANTGTATYPMEVVPVDIDENGPFEREPDPISPLSVIYSSDGIGDGSDYTGFLAFVKQGTLTRIEYTIPELLPNRTINFEPTNINHTDVWVQRIDDSNRVIERWQQIDTIAEQNLAFNDIRSTRRKFEVDTQENDKITVLFGDGDFSDIPVGTFRFWMRQSAGRSITIQKNKIVNQTMAFTYPGANGITETATITFSLTSTLQNGSATESIEHIRRSAPATYYAQNRMVNGQDYNTFMLKDPTILRLKAINRTFAGQPKYVDWHDASGTYENVKMFGDDLTMRYSMALDSQTTSVSGRALIDNVIEPLLNTSGLINMMLHISASDPLTRGVVSSPRRKFIEDNRGSRYYKSSSGFVTPTAGGDGSLKEKTAIQGLIDRHYYGEPLETIVLGDGTILGRIPDPDYFPADDSKIYQDNLPRTIDGINKFPPGDVGSGLQPIADQDYFALRYNRYMRGVGDGTISLTTANTAGSDWRTSSNWSPGEVFTIEVQADELSLSVRSNLQGTIGTGAIGQAFDFDGVEMFTVLQGSTTDLAAGDAFILDVDAVGILTPRTFPSSTSNVFNLNGWWQILGFNELPSYSSGIVDTAHFDQKFTMSTSTGSQLDGSDNLYQHSWLIMIRKIRSGTSVIGYEVHNRSLELVVESATTKFWFNAVDQLIDADTKKRVFDHVKVLRSNLDYSGQPLGTSQIYDVVGAVKDSDGIININRLQIVPTDLLNEDDSGNLIPDRLLQFENFAGTGTVNPSFEYFIVGAPDVLLTGVQLSAAIASFVGSNPSDLTALDTVNNIWYGRRLRMPSLDGGDAGLDFMWQHFAPFTNVVDPSVTNIHDLYLMTRGYYDNVISFVRGLSMSAPTAPTPLELRSSYGYLLTNKMLSDTVVLHPGKIRLLFGSLAEPQLRAKFKVVRRQGASLTNERIKEEILSVINTYFDIDNWDFGDTFYATELITLIHQRLPQDVASVVLVPVYSANSFGAMFTIESGHDEILQSAAELGDIEVVDALTPTVIRQSK